MGKWKICLCKETFSHQNREMLNCENALFIIENRKEGIHMKKQLEVITSLLACTSVFLTNGTLINAKTRITRLMDDCAKDYDTYSTRITTGSAQAYCYLNSDQIKDQIDTFVSLKGDRGDLEPIESISLSVDRGLSYNETHLSGAQFASMYLLDFSKKRRYLTIVGDCEDAWLTCAKVYKWNAKTDHITCVNNFGHDLVKRLGMYQNHAFGKTTSKGFYFNGMLQSLNTGTVRVSYYINAKNDHFTSSHYGKAYFYNKKQTSTTPLKLYKSPQSKKSAGTIGRNQTVQATHIYAKSKKLWIKLKSGKKTGWRRFSLKGKQHWFKNTTLYETN